MSQYRGSVALVLAITLGIVLVVITLAIAFGVHVTEVTRTAAVGAVGSIGGSASRLSSEELMNRVAYFDSVRQSLFGGALTQQQVDGQSVILALWEGDQTGTPMTDLRWLAYILATAYHETAWKMWPIEEYGKGEGREYGQPDKDTGEVYYGRGFVQLTWKDNYDRASGALALIDDRDLVDHPALALDSLIAARIMFRGMAEGWFTGAKLGQYFNASTDDPINARQIINGNDKDIMIADYHAKFLTALQAATLEVV